MCERMGTFLRLDEIQQAAADQRYDGSLDIFNGILA